MKMFRRFTINKREEARIFVENRIGYFNKFYSFEINRIAIKNQKTRWGSCSSKGNLNFNYKIIYLKHSKKFWALVFKTIPNYVKINRELRRTPVKFI